MVGILFAGGVMLALSALVVDVGSLMWERRQLQNGADAVVLSLADSCAKGESTCTPTTPSLSGLGNSNAADGFTRVDLVCASGTFPGSDKFSSCPSATGELVDCPPPPAGATPFVQAHTQTSVDSSNTGALLKPFIAGALGFDGVSVRACARAGWSGGHPVTILPVAQAACAWDAATSNGTDFPALPPYSLNGSGTPGVAPLPDVPVAAKYVSTILLHSSEGTLDGTAKCGATGPGLYTPGSFGWLKPEDSSSGCTADLADDTGTVGSDGKPGASATKGCKDALPGLVGSIVYVPIFTTVTSTGTNSTYTIDGVAAFYLAGFRVPGASSDGFTPRDPSGATTPSCTGEKDCMWGWYVAPVVPSGQIDTGTNRGPRLVRLLG